jgi:hypothetical protein
MKSEKPRLEVRTERLAAMALFDVMARWSPGRAAHDATPTGFEAVVEALLEGRASPDVLCAAGREAGRMAADHGTTMEGVLDDLATVCRGITGGDPSFPLVRAVAEGWSDAQLGYLHTLSCEDPLTGLTSVHHVRTRVADAYRAAARAGAEPQIALVVVDVVEQGVALSRLDRTMRMVHVAEMLRTVYNGDETLGQLSGTRAVAVVVRDQDLPQSVTCLRDMLAGWSRRGGPGSRVWIEGVPATAGGAVALLDELAR